MPSDAANERPAAVVQLRLAWAYDDALREMSSARDVAAAGGRMQLFVGCHREEVVTLGRHAAESQLVHRDALAARGVMVRRVERGGGATAHGPGQVVLYPVIHLPTCGLDVPRLTDALLGAAQDLVTECGVRSERTLGDAARAAGIYVDGRKLVSIGFRVERGVVTHGIALNVENDLTLFSLIAPCGRPAQAVCSLSSLGVRRMKISRIVERLAFLSAKRCVLRLDAVADSNSGGDVSAALSETMTSTVEPS